ncbi:MAG: response regulator transcription factor [Bacteriovoracia bacterium]
MTQTNHRILIVEDNAEVRELIADALHDEFIVDVAETLGHADEKLSLHAIDLIFLDVNLPDGNGFQYCSKIRNSPTTRDIPVIFLTGNVEVHDKVLGFSIGADDYITKPFHLEELRMRARARIGRARTSGPTETVLQVGNLRLDTERHRAALNANGQELTLDTTPIEFKLLLHFARHGKNVISRENLIEFIWDKNTSITERAIDTHLSNLRKKVTAWDHTILSVRGVGYKLASKASSSENQNPT